MTIERRRCDGGSIVVIVTECPACGKDMRRAGRSFDQHVAAFHGPADFGLGDSDPQQSLNDYDDQPEVPA
jgi:hypothetical protein